jgi:adenylate cyclase
MIPEGFMKNISGILSKKMISGLIAGLVGASIAIALYLPGYLTIWEYKTWDWRVGLLSKTTAASAKIRVILLDQKSLYWGEKDNALSWPWPREVYNPIIQFCQRGGARTLAFDVVFTEPSGYGVDDDKAFSSAIKDFRRFVGAVSLSHSSGSGEKAWPAYAPEPAFKVQGFNEWTSIMGGKNLEYSNASFPVHEIASSAGILGDVQFIPDEDNVYRRAALFHVFDGRVLPSLGLASYLAANPGTVMKIEPGSLFINDTRIPIDKQGKSIMNFRGPAGTHKNYNAAEIIQSELRIQNGEKPAINPADFKDAYVFFGYNAPGLFDLRPTPVSGIFPGVEIHATMLDNILAGDFFSSVPAIAVIIAVLLIAIFAGLVTSSVSGIAKSSVVYLFFLILPIGLSLLAYHQKIWLPVVVPETGVVLTLFSALLIYYTTEGRQKMFIKNAFRQYLSPAVIEQLIQHPENLKLGGERRMLSIFFSDLEGFTGISEGLEPEALTNLLNEYLSAMTDIIQEEGGTIDKYEGDAIIALWNAPLLLPDHARRCVRAALRCQIRLAEMRPVFRERLGKDLKMRIGMNSGAAIVGNMGSHNRFDYTMIGDAVNLASRLEGINKQFGTYTIISHSTMEQMNGLFPVRELAKVAVVGRKEPVVVYEPMMQDEFERRKQDFAVFAQALELFYKGDFQGAATIFTGIEGSDPAARHYGAKCREMIENPPGEWNGVWVITSK